jgi:hypothetical protein
LAVEELGEGLAVEELGEELDELPDGTLVEVVFEDVEDDDPSC